jgi:ATP-dependent protease ClpP protease subunit
MVVYGMAMSMGAIILQAADYRMMMPNSTMMLHYGTNGIYDHTKNFIRWSEDSKRINRVMEDIFVNRLMEKIEEDRDEWISNMKTIFASEIKNKNMRPIKLSSNLYEDVRSIVSDLLNFDTILSPEDAIKIGLSDEIHTTNS